MICYICHKHVSESLKVDQLHFGYCEEHEHMVQIGVVKYMLTGDLTKLHSDKLNYHAERRNANQIEFDKQLNIIDSIDVDEQV